MLQLPRCMNKQIWIIGRESLKKQDIRYFTSTSSIHKKYDEHEVDFSKTVCLKPSLTAKARITEPVVSTKVQSNKTDFRKALDKYQDFTIKIDNVKPKAVRHKLSGMGKYEYKRSKRVKRPQIYGEILFGIFPTLLALERNTRSFHRLYIKEDKLSVNGFNSGKHFEGNSESDLERILTLANDYGIDVVTCSGKLLTELSGDRPHQGVCLDASPLTYHPVITENMTQLQEEHKPMSDVWLFLESVRDPMNFGAILRTAYYFGISQIICTSSNSCALSPVVSKVSAGVLELLKIYSVDDHLTFIKKLKDRGWVIVGTVGHDEQNNDKVQHLHDFSSSSNILLLLGNEGKGLSCESLALCDKLVTVVPQANVHHSVDSLNVSVATGIVLHHVTRR